MDGRRRQWFPLDSTFMFGRLACRLKHEFGPVGPLVWIAFLAACKRYHIQGRIQFGSEIEAWRMMGFTEPVDNFDLEAFWRRLGQLHKTSRRRDGDLTTIICRVWDDWNTTPGRPANPQVRGTKYKQITTEYKPVTAPDSDSDSDSDKTAAAEPKQAVDNSRLEVAFRINRGDTIRNPDRLAEVIAACYRGECGESCGSPLHGLAALWWHHGRRMDETQASRATAAQDRPTADLTGLSDPATVRGAIEDR